MVYGKYMSRGFSNEFVIVVAPCAKAFEQFAADMSNDNPASRTVRISSKSQDARDFNKLEARMLEVGETPEAIYLLEDGCRDFERGGVWITYKEWVSRSDS